MAKKNGPSSKRILDPRKMGLKIQDVRKVVVNRMNVKGMTPYALAKAANAAGGKVTEQTVRNFVGGKSDITSDKLAALFAVLGLEVKPKE